MRDRARGRSAGLAAHHPRVAKPAKTTKRAKPKKAPKTIVAKLKAFEYGYRHADLGMEGTLTVG